MTHNQPASLPYETIPAQFRNDIRNWSSTHRDGSVSDDLDTLRQSVALFYADPRRPSIRQLYAKLCEMLGTAERHSGIKLPRPSLPEFRTLVLTLPNEFIEHARYGQWGTWDILSPAVMAAHASDLSNLSIQ
jgi:hypothetical protein